MGGAEEYNSTNQDGLQGRKEILGFESIPGEQYQSTIVCTKCPTCQVVGATKTTTSWSMKSCLCIYCCGGYWGLWQLLKGKDFIPKDCVHNCGTCGVEIAQYKSCEEIKVTVSASTEEKK
jgi:hypothetical protein|tara:strand:+ start:54 stop:413 length:360 start_codon:yes stop_codon:yes gene_type:complete